MSTLKKPVEVEIYTASHRVRGSVVPGALGLFSYLNMPTESYLEVEAGDLTLLHQTEGRRFSRLWVVKGEISAVLVANRAGLGPSSTIRAGYTKPFPHWVCVIVGGYELRGQIQSGGRFDFGAVMFEGGNSFVPLYDGHLEALLFPRVQADAPALLFNRGHVRLLQLEASEAPT